MVNWTWNKVQQLPVRGYSQWDVAEEQQIDQSTISRDVHYLRQNAQANLQKHIQQKLPEEFQRCLTGMNQVYKKAYYNFVKQDTQSREGVSVFFKDPAGRVFHTYSAYARGIDMLNVAYHYLDIVPKGRDEAGHEFPQFWVRRHDEYGKSISEV